MDSGSRIAHWRILLSIISLTLFSCPSAQAKVAEAAGIAPPGLTRCIKTLCVQTQQTVGQKALPLNGLRLFKYWGFNLYSAAFYAPAATHTSEAALADIPKSLVLHYHRKIRADQIIKAATHNLAKNPGNNLEALQPLIDQMHAAFVDVQKGDLYELRYIPGTGTTLLFNGKPRVTIPGTDFQQAYFGIWLSEYAINDQLRDGLLDRKSA